MWVHALILSFITSLIVGPLIIRAANSRRVLLVRDMHKRGNVLVSTLGGVIILAGFCAGILLEVWFKTSLVLLLAATASILIITILGLLDDLIDLPQLIRAVLPLFAAAPLMAVKAGTTSMTLPFFGVIELGLLYHLLIVPVGVTGAANAVNMIAGLNGLEAGLSSVMTLTLLLISLKIGSPLGAVLSAAALGALLAFLKFNWAPAKILPGNSGSYFAGTVIAAICILANMEKAGLIMMGPYFIELLLKSRTWFKAESFGKLRKDGTITTDRVDSLTHLIMRLGRFTESQIVSILMLVEAFFAVIAYVTAG